MEDVAIVGIGQTDFSRKCGVSIRDLCFDAFKDAMQDANIDSQSLDASIVCSAPEYDKQRTPSGLISEYLGLTPKPTFYVESVCSSSSMGLRVAYSLISSGLHDLVAVIGFQKMSEITSEESQERMGRGADIQWESPFGTMMPAYYAMYARAHMHRYGTTLEDLAGIRVKSATYGQINNKAVYRKPVTKEMLIQTLSKFDGTMIFVSHDRTFLRGMANNVLDLSGVDNQGNSKPMKYGCTYEEWVDRTGHEAPGVWH